MKNKKDCRLFCKLFYIASPCENALGEFRAGCRIPKHGIPSKNCKKCKYGVDNLLAKKLTEGFVEGFKRFNEKYGGTKND